MSKRVGWLFLWTTLTFWVGCSQAHRSGEGDLSADAKAYQAALSEDVEPAAAAEPAPAEADLGVSIVGLDRDNWKPIEAGPARGKVPHHPHYYDSGFARLSSDRPDPLAGETIEERAATVTGGSRAPFNGTVVAETPLMFGKFAADLVLWPVKAVMDPPWAITYSP